jgi:oxalate decarboxylase/phosphoglucose isomerase-like protein (cupin superfamily)
VAEAVKEETRIINHWWNSAYDRWLQTQDAPVTTGYYVDDLREVPRGYWSLRGCPAAILKLKGHEGVTEARVLEIPAGQTISPFRMALEEVIYVAEGNGIATVWAEGMPKVVFEWQKHSFFRIPNNYWYQLANTRGDRPAITLHCSYLPMAMAINPNPDYFFKNEYVDTTELYTEEGNFYSSEARAMKQTVNRGGEVHTNQVWYANFFPDLTLWDHLDAYGAESGRLAYSGGIQFPNSAIRTGLMVLPSKRYRNAHRHGPGVTIVGIQEADGYVIMWPEGASREEHIICPWKEGSVFVPPNHWYHMHVNAGAQENRQLRIFPPQPLMNYTAADPEKIIPFTKEEPWIRQMFEEETAKRGLKSLMPPECYTDPNYQWDARWLKED